MFFRHKTAYANVISKGGGGGGSEVGGGQGGEKYRWYRLLSSTPLQIWDTENCKCPHTWLHIYSSTSVTDKDGSAFCSLWRYQHISPLSTSYCNCSFKWAGASLATIRCLWWCLTHADLSKENFFMYFHLIHIHATTRTATAKTARGRAEERRFLLSGSPIIWCCSFFCHH